jgi:hypothetical protein
MSWKFWDNRRNYEPSMAEISSRLRGFILDSQIHNAHEIAILLGCSISSIEVMEKEEEESEKRVERISYLFPIIYAHSHALAEGAIEIQKGAMKDAPGVPEIPLEIWQESRKLMEQVSVASLLGTVSQLVDLGLLEIPKHKKRRT